MKMLGRQPHSNHFIPTSVCSVLLLSQHIETAHSVGLIGLGGFGYLLKDRVLDVSDFLASVARVAGGGSALDPQVAAALLHRADGRSAVSRLTEREHVVLALMAQGLAVLGNQAGQRLTVRREGLHGIERLLTDVASLGGDGFHIDGVALSPAHPQQALSRAWELAFADARAKAEQFASLAGRSLGRVGWMDERPSGGGPRPTMAMRAGAADSMSVATGDAQVASMSPCTGISRTDDGRYRSIAVAGHRHCRLGEGSRQPPRSVRCLPTPAGTS